MAEETTALVLPSYVKPEETAIVGFTNLADIRAPYLAFPMKLSSKWAEYASDAPEDNPLREYEPLVITPNPLGDKAERIGSITPSGTSFDFIYLSGYQCYTELDIKNGAILASALSYDSAKANSSLVEHCEGVLLAFSADKANLYPVRGSFRKAMSGIIKNCEKALLTIKDVESRDAQKDWYGVSPEHGKTALFPLNYRFICRATVFTMPQRENPNFKYPTARTRFIPMTETLIAKIQELHKDPEFQANFTAVCRSYAFRNNEIARARIDV